MVSRRFSQENQSNASEKLFFGKTRWFHRQILNDLPPGGLRQLVAGPVGDGAATPGHLCTGGCAVGSQQLYVDAAGGCCAPFFQAAVRKRDDGLAANIGKAPILSLILISYTINHH